MRTAVLHSPIGLPVVGLILLPINVPLTQYHQTPKQEFSEFNKWAMGSQNEIRLNGRSRDNFFFSCGIKHRSGSSHASKPKRITVPPLPPSLVIRRHRCEPDCSPISADVQSPPFIHSFNWHVKNATIPFRSQELLLPFLSVIYPFLPHFSTN